MLELENRSSFTKEDSVILKKRQIHELFNSMATMLNPKMSEDLREVVIFLKSIFEISRFVETFGGKTMEVANYNVFHKTIQFARQYFVDKSKKMF